MTIDNTYTVAGNAPWPLTCPVCGTDSAALTVHRRENGKPSFASCAEGHRFDAARQGHINLLTGRGTSFTPDTREMVASRVEFLESGYYEPIAQTIRTAIAEHAGHAIGIEDSNASPLMLDAGCGTGYYLKHALDGRAGYARGIGFDISPAAAQRAAQVDGALSLVWDVWRPWPVASHCTDAILNVFSPRNWEEFRRVLKTEGVLIVVTPLPEHLVEIRELAGLLSIQEDKQQHLSEEARRHGFELAGEYTIKRSMQLTHDAVAALAHMGPAGHHQSREDIMERIERESIDLSPEETELAQLTVTCNVQVSAFTQTPAKA